MEAKNEIINKIESIIAQIKSKHPALRSYLKDMQVTIPEENGSEKSIEHLQAYYDTLTTILRDYADRRRSDI